MARAIPPVLAVLRGNSAVCTNRSRNSVHSVRCAGFPETLLRKEFVMLLRNWMVYGSVVALVWTAGCGETGNGPEAASGVQATATADEALWCKEHGVEEKYCVICHPEIKENSDMLLCPEHGNIPEAICTACHPELKDKYETCPHELPPAFCPNCAEQDGEQHDHGHDHQHDGEKQS